MPPKKKDNPAKFPPRHTMAAQKVNNARVAAIRHGFEGTLDASAHSDSDSEASHDESNSDSDSLDSQASRKRRRISPSLDEEPPLPKLSVPSRVNSRIQNKDASTYTNSSAIPAPTDPQTTFSALNVKPWLVGSLGAMAIKRPTGIQKHCIPEILKGRDCIGGSRTGSGKTVAFAVPILQKWAEDPFGIFAVVLTPTR